MIRYRYPKTERLLRKRDFKHVYQQAQAIHNAPLRILYRQNALQHPRLGISLPRYKVRRAVDRNRLKRLFRESFRHHHHALNAFDMVVTLTQSIETIDNNQIEQCLTRLWRQLNSLSGD